jgi:hypothetical protein
VVIPGGKHDNVICTIESSEKLSGDISLSTPVCIVLTLSRSELEMGNVLLRTPTSQERLTISRKADPDVIPMEFRTKLTERYPEEEPGKSEITEREIRKIQEETRKEV